MILVTGATGHIGNVLVRELLGRGERVRALVRPGKMPPALAGLDVELAVEISWTWTRSNMPCMG